MAAVPPVEKSSPRQHGRYRLDGPSHDAERLLDAARAGNDRARARLAIYCMAGGQKSLDISAARETTARELGFQSWSDFKRHVTALDRAADLARNGLDADMETMHIRCGDDLRGHLPDAGFQGRFCTFTDPFCIGPVHDLGRDQFVESRITFLSQVLGLDENDIRDWQQREYQDLDDSRNSRRVVLWFEHDSYDQLILAYLLHYYGEQMPRVRVELVVADSVPGVSRFVGLGQLDPEVLSWLWQQRRPVDEAMLALGRRAWRAVTGTTPERLDSLSQTLTPALPMLRRALRRHLLELPEEHTGLGLSEQLTVQLVAERGPITVENVFQALIREREPLPYLGDTLFWWMMQPLMSGDMPLLESAQGEDTHWSQRQLAITDHGHAVLSGHQNWLDSRPPRRWVGGVPVDGDRESWCLNKATGRPQRRPAGAA